MSILDTDQKLTAYLNEPALREKWEDQELKRKKFIQEFPASRILDLSKDEYIQGKGSKDSFCYKVERELKDLGHIFSQSISKFGFWYSRKEQRYGFAHTKYGPVEDIAFERVKQAIHELLVAGKRYDLATIAKNPISPMFKGKILYLYYPTQYLNVFAGTHLHYFLDTLGLQPDRPDEIYLQDRLMRFKASIPALDVLTTNQLAGYLYSQFGYPPKEQDKVVAKNQAQVEFIDELPQGSSADPEAFATGEDDGNPDYGKRAKKLKAIGNLGEEIVLNKERERLSGTVAHDKLDHVALKNDSKGYDILSFDDDEGKIPRYIEVKATTAKNLSQGFYLTENELQKSHELDNYYLYIVFDVKGKYPKIWRKKAPFENAFFDLRPRQYQVFTAD
jgi:hypothetical protein